MAATLDKEALAKHGFWILSGVYVLLVLGCLALLITSVGDSIRKEDDELKNAEQKVKGITDPKNQEVVAAYTKQDEIVNKKKDEVWSKAWKLQEDMMTWPRDLQARFQKYKYFGEPIDRPDRYEFQDKYVTQLKDVWEVVQPVQPNGEGVVQCKGDWGEVLALDRSFSQVPTREDIWFAQEELWVKREMLRIIRAANESVARFREVHPEDATAKEKKDAKAESPASKDAKDAKTEIAAADKEAKKPVAAPPAPKGDPNHKIFRNPYWEFDLTLVGSDTGRYRVRGKLTNISPRQQALDTKFKIFLQDPDKADSPSALTLTMASLPLAAGESKPIDEGVREQLAIEGLFGVEQVLNWRTAAVKRLDQIALMYPSSRTTRTPKPLPAFAEPVTPEGGDAAAAAGGDAAAAATNPTTGATGLPGPALAALPSDTTLNGLQKFRYTDTSPQVRHMQVAMVVVVDEERLAELLAAFVNSKLRIQINQYHWQHCRDRMNPGANEGNQPYIPGAVVRDSRPLSSGPPGPPRVGTIGMASGAGMPYKANNPLLGRSRGGERDMMNPSAGRGPMPSGPAGPPRPTGGVSGALGTPYRGGSSTFSNLPTEGEEEEDLNLLEVSVYGLASLYERYPPPKPSAPAADAAAPADKAAAPAAGK